MKEIDVLDVLYEMIEKLPDDKAMRNKHLKECSHRMVDMIFSLDSKPDRMKLTSGFNIVVDFGKGVIDRDCALSKLHELREDKNTALT